MFLFYLGKDDTMDDKVNIVHSKNSIRQDSFQCIDYRIELKPRHMTDKMSDWHKLGTSWDMVDTHLRIENFYEKLSMQKVSC